jgi:hypothetical protein
VARLHRGDDAEAAQARQVGETHALQVLDAGTRLEGGAAPGLRRGGAHRHAGFAGVENQRDPRSPMAWMATW